jgi:3-phosphoshikimate 1-carboxyvinyltransferase
MDLELRPSVLQGRVQVPSSKSLGHRDIICSGLALGEQVVDNIAVSEDIRATNRCLAALGVQVEETASRYPGRTAFKYTTTGPLRVVQPVADCGESGSTLRFFIPLGALCNAPLTFQGRGKLVSRPLDPYYKIFETQHLSYQTGERGQLPLTVNGRLQPGTYELPGDVSSQFVSGLLFALPLLEKESVLKVLPPVESASYIELTLAVLARFGIRVERRDEHVYLIPGRQHYQSPGPAASVEGDWSQAAFWLVAGTIGRGEAAQNGITSLGLNPGSLQGDRAVVKIIQQMGGALTREHMAYLAQPAETAGVTIDAADCPDLVPILSVLAALSSGTTRIINAGRLRLKECDRLAAMAAGLNKLGARVQELSEGLVIEGRPEGLDGGAEVSAWNDHRIAMSLAVASTRCAGPVRLTGAESVQKSYPEFWQDFAALGGKYNSI